MRHWRHILAIATMLGALPLAAQAGDTPNQAAGTASAPAPAPAPAPVPAALERVLASPDIRLQFWFGVAVENLPPLISRQLKLKPDQGLMISVVLPDSPAAAAGLETGDILTEINGQALTSQTDLNHAANPIDKGKAVPAARESKLTYLRDGVSATVGITPAPRPENMIVFGDARAKTGKVYNYAMPNGGGAQVSPGYIIRLEKSDPRDFTAMSIRQIVSKGQTVVLTKATDTAGNVRNTITVGSTVYDVDAASLTGLPAELQPFGQQLLDATPRSAATRPGTSPAPATAAPSMEQRVKDLEAQNAELKRKVDALMAERAKEPAGK